MLNELALWMTSLIAIAVAIVESAGDLAACVVDMAQGSALEVAGPLLG